MLNCCWSKGSYLSGHTDHPAGRHSIRTNKKDSANSSCNNYGQYCILKLQSAATVWCILSSHCGRYSVYSSKHVSQRVRCVCRVQPVNFAQVITTAAAVDFATTCTTKAELTVQLPMTVRQKVTTSQRPAATAAVSGELFPCRICGKLVTLLW